MSMVSIGVAWRQTYDVADMEYDADVGEDLRP